LCASDSDGYNDHDNLDHNNLNHSYITTGYLDIDIKNNIYNNSRISVNSAHVITCVHSTPVVTAGGGDTLEGDTFTAPKCQLAMIMCIKDTVDDDKKEKTMKAHKTSNTVAIVYFTPATIERNVRMHV
jgi:hypothetical protein